MLSGGILGAGYITFVFMEDKKIIMVDAIAGLILILLGFLPWIILLSGIVLSLISGEDFFAMQLYKKKDHS